MRPFKLPALRTRNRAVPAHYLPPLGTAAREPADEQRVPIELFSATTCHGTRGSTMTYLDW